MAHRLLGSPPPHRATWNWSAAPCPIPAAHSVAGIRCCPASGTSTASSSAKKTEVATKEQDYRYTESLILPGEQVYAIGEFSTIGGENTDLNLNQDVSELLSRWKGNKPALLASFDLDKDGQISEKEWMLARSQARREVRKTHNEIRTQPGTHMLHQPRDGRFFLISNLDPQSLHRRYTLWAWLHLVVLVGAIAGTAFFATSS